MENKVKESLKGYSNVNKNFKDFVLIGEGGYGAVYSATFIRDNKRYAIKLLTCKDIAKKQITLKRFENECKLLKKINSNNVVKIKGHYISENESYYAMELIEGIGLAKVIERHKKLNPETAVSYAKDICQGLIDIHDNGIIHRDLKPSNIIIQHHDNTAKLIDFGISLDEESLRVTAANKTVGSVNYLAPELISRNRGPSVQSDIYAFGIILFEMLAGYLPYRGSDFNAVMLLHLNQPLPDLPDVNVTIPQPLENIIIKCCAKDLTQRYQDCHEILKDLQTCLKTERANEPKLNLNPNKVKESLKKKFNSKAFEISFFSIVGSLLILVIILLGLYLGGVI
ncbi:serine/threonine protein kinase [[Mycoplasma] falconis]|uniref:mitogen-activated protein kinase kinase n=1 Tax=[Mycoplasma] falconis TaxID=92403 RepID=A0A501X9N9_9BACT|nr:serine/threonine-protein kinase [[Mycoplasma] falconis]TPE57083.1 serine/threonine protein kinase [[Mycoplasma] falconis]